MDPGRRGYFKSRRQAPKSTFITKPRIERRRYHKAYRAPGKARLRHAHECADSFTYHPDERKAAQAGLRVRVHTRTSTWTTLKPAVPYEDPPETTV